MGQRPSDALYWEICEFASRLGKADVRTHPGDVLKWGQLIAVCWAEFDLKMRAGDDLPTAWKVTRTDH